MSCNPLGAKLLSSFSEIRQCHDSSLWNGEARRVLRIQVPEWFTYYIGNLYRKATKIGLKWVRVNTNKISLLKTDLWNEGIETGRDVLSQYQNEKRFNLHGVDISHLVCCSAQKSVQNIHIMQANIKNLPLKDTLFDIVLDLSTLDHVPLHQVPGVIQEYRRALKKGGVLVLVYWCESVLLRLIFKLHRIKNYREQPVWGTQYYFPVNQVKECVKGDFNILEEFWTGSLLNFNNRVVAPILKSLPNPVYDLILHIEYSKISKYLLKGFAGLHVIIARRK